MYIPRNWEFGSVLAKLLNFGGGGVTPHPLGTPLGGTSVDRMNASALWSWHGPLWNRHFLVANFINSWVMIWLTVWRVSWKVGKKVFLREERPLDCASACTVLNMLNNLPVYAHVSSIQIWYVAMRFLNDAFYMYCMYLPVSLSVSFSFLLKASWLVYVPSGLTPQPSIFGTRCAYY
jgi:hypothetical protein